VTALVDSGNSLVEPISGKPVSVISKDTLNKLRGNEQDIYRAIPYRSIGRSGILKGYLMQEVEIKLNGVTKVCRDVYVAVPDEYTASEGMILNPLLLKS
jgi:stage II sporulation protein GA (sporulation sigma-E factor processing peptidase)